MFYHYADGGINRGGIVSLIFLTVRRHQIGDGRNSSLYFIRAVLRQ